MDILLVLLAVILVLYLLGGRSVAGGRYAATGPAVGLLWVVVAIVLVFVIAGAAA